MIPNSPFSCDILCLHGCCCRFACPQVYEAGEGTHRRRRLTPGRGHQEGTIGSGSGRLSDGKLQEMVRAREAWCAAVGGATKSWT